MDRRSFFTSAAVLGIRASLGKGTETEKKRTDRIRKKLGKQIGDEKVVSFHRHRVVVGLIPHQRLGTDSRGPPFAGCIWRCRQRQ
jgi:hypothetical protein